MILTHLAMFSFFDGMSSGPVPEPPAPDVAVVQRFGGGPFWSKYGYDEAYDDIREQSLDEEEADEIRDALAPTELRAIDDAVSDAASAMLRNEQPAVVLDYQAAYQRILASQKGLRKELRSEFAARRAFKAEVRRRVQVAEDDDMAVAILYLLDD